MKLFEFLMSTIRKQTLTYLHHFNISSNQDLFSTLNLMLNEPNNTRLSANKMDLLF